VGQDYTSWPLFVSLFIVIGLAMNAALTLMGWPKLIKPLLVAIVFISAVASYYMNAYGVFIDRDMIRNLVETNYLESRDFITPDLLMYLVVWGVFPSWLIVRQPIQFQPRLLRVAVHKSVIIAVSMAMVAGIVLLEYKQYSIFFRNNRHVRHLVVPVNALYGTFGFVKQTYYNSPKQLRTVGTDATPGPVLRQAAKRTLLVLVVGETARASNFSLQGYARETNPRLKKIQGGHYFSNVMSCGTSTATSVPCMFSADTRETFSDDHARHTEGLLDVLHHAGVRVLWLDNNTGCKGVCARVESEDLTQLTLPGVCSTDGCLDAVFLKRFEDILAKDEGPLVVVVHQIGSHGPAYYKRYPPAFRRFTPTCDQGQIDQCEQQAIINTYDNSLLYTDSMLADLIAMLERNNDRFDSAMLYVSDHGESLGENGVYLHGMPYFMAPDNQKHIPMYAWFSSGFNTLMGMDAACLTQRTNAAFSHDHLFHSVLGMMNIQTTVYRENLDMFAGCHETILVNGDPQGEQQNPVGKRGQSRQGQGEDTLPSRALVEAATVRARHP
jgi:lipid A ethanolaminephosphotransferase